MFSFLIFLIIIIITFTNIYLFPSFLSAFSLSRKLVLVGKKEIELGKLCFCPLRESLCDSGLGPGPTSLVRLSPLVLVTSVRTSHIKLINYTSISNLLVNLKGYDMTKHGSIKQIRILKFHSFNLFRPGTNILQLFIFLPFK